jgi:CheY-like chemotaxis protein
MKVLIVEDSEQMRRMIKRFIRDQVDEFVECEDGSEALAAYSQHHPDLVLMDVQMRNIDGFRATREIKAASSSARVVIVSQWDSPKLRETASVAGAEGYVTKMDLMPLRDFLEAGRCKP